MIVEDLAKAEETNTDYSFNRDLHKVVIVKKPITETNSHPVVNFSSMGIPVIYCDNIDKLEEMLLKVGEGTPLAVCTQSGNLALCGASPEAFICEGYVVHPAKLAISSNTIQLPGVGKPAPQPQEVKNLLMQTRAIDTSLQAIQKLKQTGLKEKREKLQARIKQEAPDRAKAILKSVEALEKQMAVSFSELKKAVKTNQGERLHPLFHSKVVETLFTQPEAPRALGQVSVANVQPQLRAVEAMLDYQDRFDFPALLSEQVLEGANLMTDEQVTIWKHFLVGLEKGCQAGTVSKKEIEDFKKMLHSLKDLNLLCLWFARFFLPIAEQEPIKVLQELKALFTPATEHHLNEMGALLKEIDTLRDTIDFFEEPDKFAKMFNQLLEIKNELVKLPQTFEKLTPLGRISTVKVLNAFVEVEDTATKTMKKSQQYPVQQKVQHFDQMIHPSLDLLENWLTGLAGQHLKYHSQWPLDTYLEKLRERFGRTTDTAKELNPSQFSVMAAILNLSTAFDRSLPNTKEDVFTLIHQNLLVVIQVLTGLEMKNQVVLPPQVAQRMESAAPLPAQLIGYDFEPDQLIVHYNYPLRNHSARFDIRYDKETKETYLDVWFLGLARERWDFIRLMLDYFHQRGQIDLVSAALNPTELRYTLKINDPQKAAFSISKLESFAKYTLGETSFQDLFENRDQAIKAVIDFSNISKFQKMATGLLLGFCKQSEKEKNPAKTRDMILKSFEARIHLYPFRELMSMYFRRHEEQVLNKIREGLGSTDVKDHEKAARVLVNACFYISDYENHEIYANFVELAFHPKIIAAVAAAQEQPGRASSLWEQERWTDLIATLFKQELGFQLALACVNDVNTPQPIKDKLKEMLTDACYFLKDVYAKEGFEAALDYIKNTSRGSANTKTLVEGLSNMISQETEPLKQFKYVLQAALHKDFRWSTFINIKLEGLDQKELVVIRKMLDNVLENNPVAFGEILAWLPRSAVNFLSRQR
ncbi:MAG: hypothetical protein LLG04_11385 [Parachlamydia sp.]|nr:hypothetical protein [Parachlamydia sp.]